MRYARNILCLVSTITLCFSGLFTNSTFYTSASLSTPYVNDVLNVEDNYKYNIGLRKIALFPNQKSSRFYKGNEKALSDNALFGALEGLEYLISASSIRNQGHEYIDQEYWIKWSNKNFIAKFKYLDK